MLPGGEKKLEAARLTSATTHREQRMLDKISADVL